MGIVYAAGRQIFKAKNEQSQPVYPLREFIDDYYKLDLDIFKYKVLNLIGCDMDEGGYVLYQEN